MPTELTIKVIYPLQGGRIILRTDANWNSDVEAAQVSGDRTVTTFRVSTSRPFFYFKPCVIDQFGFHWSKGNNYLAITGAGDTKSIYPYFFSDQGGTVSDILEFYSGPSNILHRVRVYQPPGYFENTIKRYPVLYMHDGNNLFFPNEAFLGNTWGVGQTMDMLDSMNVIDKTLIVGIYPYDRMNEYTKPGYEAYGRFIVEQLRGFVRDRYRPLDGAENSAVMGSSLGGVVSMYLAWQWPEVFGKAGCLSSTFTYRDDLMQRIASEPKRAIRVYIDSGWPGDNYEATRSMRDVLARAGYEFGKDLLYFAFPNALHSETYWSMRSHIPFQFFFGKTPDFNL
ncbi:MAG TPA: alpha/beta hydrolase-fold protein [Pyrinomonadaceae bacterium]